MDKYRNQSAIINIDEFDYLKIAIIGIGSIGSFLTLALHKIGFTNIIVVDSDTVERHNIPTQLYNKEHIGLKKTESINDILDQNVYEYDGLYEPDILLDVDIVFICVDSLVQRKLITKGILDSYEKHKKPKLIIDGRMHCLVFTVYTIPVENPTILNNYVQSTLQKEFKGSCNEKGIIQNTLAVVAVMVEQLKKVLNGEEAFSEVNCDFERYLFINTNQIKEKEEKSNGI